MWTLRRPSPNSSPRSSSLRTRHQRPSPSSPRRRTCVFFSLVACPIRARMASLSSQWPAACSSSRATMPLSMRCSSKTVTKRAPTEAELNDLRFAFRIAKHVKSNTIVYAKDRATVGIGAGQMSRVDAARIAARKAEDVARDEKLAAPLTKGSVRRLRRVLPVRGRIVGCHRGRRNRCDPARRLDAR